MSIIELVSEVVISVLVFILSVILSVGSFHRVSKALCVAMVPMKTTTKQWQPLMASDRFQAPSSVRAHNNYQFKRVNRKITALF